MFVGHLGAALALQRADQDLNAGTLAFAALFLDALLWVLVLLGLEQVQPPPDFATLHYQRFTFPYSHGLLAAGIWTVLPFGISQVLTRRSRAAVVVALAVFSHFVLDWIEHPPQMPLMGNSSPMLGLGLWNHLVIALSLEVALVAAGLWIYLRCVRDQSRVRRVGMVGMVALLSVMAVAGQMTSREAPPPAIAAWSSLVTIAVLSAVIYSLDRRKSA